MVYLAAYGTLMSGQANPLPAEVLASLPSAGPCTISGALYAVGPAFRYPRLLDQPGEVQGELFGIEGGRTQIGAVLAALDVYEMFDPRRPEGSAFVRRRVRLMTPAVDAWLYLYNPAATGAAMTPIPSGRWTDFRV